jgi:hypothetical protein
MKRSDQVFLAIVGGLFLVGYMTSDRHCRTDEWNSQTDCRSRSSGSWGGSYGRSTVRRGGFGHSGGHFGGGG